MPQKFSFVTSNRYDPNTGCWNWMGKHPGNLYGRFKYNGRYEFVHRLSAHFYLNFDLASPLCVLHRCDNPKCFNPKHLFIGTHADNMQDCIAKGRFKARGGRPAGSLTQCPKGHPYSGDNVCVNSKGYRECRACRNEGNTRWRLKNPDYHKQWLTRNKN